VSGTSGLEVTPLPTAGRPADFTGAVARNLTVTDSISPPVAQQGEAVTASLVLRGEGNVALWPAPGRHLASGVPGLPRRDGRAGLDHRWPSGWHQDVPVPLVADSAGTTAIPAVRYSYFDPGHRDLCLHPHGEREPDRGATIRRCSAPGHTASAHTRCTPGLAREIRETFFPWVWWVALLIGPLVFAGRVIHLPRRAKRTEPPRADSLAAVERELSRMVAAWPQDRIAMARSRCRRRCVEAD
jgi:hypothetical protein